MRELKNKSSGFSPKRHNDIKALYEDVLGMLYPAMLTLPVSEEQNGT
jgi:hypothetical protein